MKYGTRSQEKRYEKKLIRNVEALGGICLKFTSPQSDGWPDRIIVMPNGYSWWMEIKDKGVEPDKLQEKRIEKLNSLGQNASFINSDETLNDFINLLKLYFDA